MPQMQVYVYAVRYINDKNYILISKKTHPVSQIKIMSITSFQSSQLW